MSSLASRSPFCQASVQNHACSAGIIFQPCRVTTPSSTSNSMTSPSCTPRATRTSGGSVPCPLSRSLARATDPSFCWLLPMVHLSDFRFNYFLTFQQSAVRYLPAIDRTGDGQRWASPALRPAEPKPEPTPTRSQRSPQPCQFVPFVGLEPLVLWRY